MNIKFFVIVSLIYAVTEKWIFVEAPPSIAQKPSAEERATVIDQVKNYFPVLLKLWGIYGTHRKLIKLAIGCEKLGIVCPFSSSWRLLLLSIGGELNTNDIRYLVMGNDTFANALSDDEYQKIVEFNDLVKTVRKSSEETDIWRVVESTDSLLSNVLSKFISGADRLSKSTVIELGDSMKSCLILSVHIKNNKPLQQDFIDAIKKGATMTSKDLENESGSFLNIQKTYSVEDCQPSVEERGKMQKIDSILAQKRETSRDNSENFRTRRSEQSLLSRLFGFFRGKDEDNPFNYCTKEYDDPNIR